MALGALQAQTQRVSNGKVATLLTADFWQDGVKGLKMKCFLMPRNRVLLFQVRFTHLVLKCFFFRLVLPAEQTLHFLQPSVEHRALLFRRVLSGLPKSHRLMPTYRGTVYRLVPMVLHCPTVTVWVLRRPNAAAILLITLAFLGELITMWKVPVSRLCSRSPVMLLCREVFTFSAHITAGCTQPMSISMT